MDLGQARIAVEENARSVGECALFKNGRGGKRDRLAKTALRRLFAREKRHRRHLVAPQVMPGEARDILRLQRFEVAEVAVSVIQIPHHDLGEPEARGLPADSLAGVDFPHDGLAAGFFQFGEGHTALAQFAHGVMHGGFDRAHLRHIGHVGDPQQAGGSGVPRHGVNVVHEVALFAQRFP